MFRRSCKITLVGMNIGIDLVGRAVRYRCGSGDQIQRLRHVHIIKNHFSRLLNGVGVIDEWLLIASTCGGTAAGWSTTVQDSAGSQVTEKHLA